MSHHLCKHHRHLKPEEKKALDKLKADLQVKAQLKDKDPRLFYVEGLGSHPPDWGQCWVYHPHLHFVARGQIMKKTPGTVDTHATWEIRILQVDGMRYKYYEDMRETCTRSQLWPTKRECYAALDSYLEKSVKLNLKENKRLEERRTQIARLT